MKIHYDPEADAFAVHFAPTGAYVESEEVAPGVVLDFDANEQVIGIEVLDVRKRMASGQMNDDTPSNLLSLLQAIRDDIGQIKSDISEIKGHVAMLDSLHAIFARRVARMGADVEQITSRLDERAKFD